MKRTAAPTIEDAPRQSAPSARTVLATLVTLLACGGSTAAQDDGASPVVPAGWEHRVLEHDDTEISRSTLLEIPKGLVLEDAQGDGVVRVVADGVHLRFAPGSVLRGAAPGVPPDAYAGLGLVVDGHRDVTLSGLDVSGFQTAVLARDADGLTVAGCDLSDNWRQRLRSTAQAADDGSDWLAPHANDEQQWRRRYGAALCVEDSAGVSLLQLRVRDTQNGVILDRVVDSEVLACDLSFLSGWGLALWRSSRNVIAGNALDFCVRGYSHGVYNRGQDSAGLLIFEQCHDNLIAENSITHGGDGIFAFAGSEALGEGLAEDDGLDRTDLGHHGNLIVGNDLSFAAAHGLELTFAGTNLVRENRFEGNAICGIWGGYSRGLHIEANHFAANGQEGYGLERGGVNIEHGRDNVVLANRFEQNACGVHLWWDEDPHLADLPWSRANGTDCSGNAIVANRFVGDTLGIQLRACAPTLVRENARLDVEQWLDAAEGAVTTEGPRPPGQPLPSRAVADLERLTQLGLGVDPGDRPRGRDDGSLQLFTAWPRGTPVGARPGLRGREHIVLGDWGPWDHASPLLRRGARGADHHRIDVLARPSGAALHCSGEGVTFETDDRLVDAPPPSGVGDEATGRLDTAVTIRPEPGARGVLPYRVAVDGVGVIEDQLVAATWDLTVFPWTVDPREDVVAWRAEADGPGAVRTTVPTLDLPYGGGGPSQLDLGAAVRAADLPGDRFGTLATTRLPLTAGTWRLTTVSDDGVRVRVDGQLVIDHWTWHAPTTDTATFEVRADGQVVLAVEHFELDGWATLELRLTREE